MQGYYITGPKGSYIELEDGRWADTVSEDDGDGHTDVEELLEELTDQGDYPEFCDLNEDDLRKYVGLPPLEKRFTVTYGPRYFPQHAEIVLSGVIASEPLTPALAARAARVACGHRDGVTVWSNDDHGYRLYAKSARRLTREAQ